MRVEADLVLDLTPSPLIGDRVPPPGYFAESMGQDGLDAVLSSLVDMVGVFEKPTYFDYDPDLCAHARNGVTACTRCLDACPTQAIVSIGDLVEVDPNLCQGLGGCASACPSGAIRYSYPAPGDALQFIRTLLLIAAGHLDRVSGVAQVQKVDPLHHTAGMNIQARNNSLRKHL